MAYSIRKLRLLKVLCLLLAWPWLRYDPHIADYVVAEVLGNSQLNRSRAYKMIYSVARIMYGRERARRPCQLSLKLAGSTFSDFHPQPNNPLQLKVLIAADSTSSFPTCSVSDLLFPSPPSLHPMAGPKEEWLIWAEECQHHIKSINERLNNISLPTDQLESLSEKLKDIIATCSQLQDENNALQDRVLRLEQEINEQDQINAVKSQQQEQLKAHFKTQESEFDNVIQAVSRMQRTNAVEREQYQREMKELRDLVEGLVSGGQINSVQARPRK